MMSHTQCNATAKSNGVATDFDLLQASAMLGNTLYVHGGAGLGTSFSQTYAADVGIQCMSVTVHVCLLVAYMPIACALRYQRPMYACIQAFAFTCVHTNMHLHMHAQLSGAQ
jgi:hypothetical protein